MNIRLSASMIKDFLSCNRKAYYRLSQPEEQESTYHMTVGIIVHEVLEKHWNDYDKAIELAEKLIMSYNLKKGHSIIYRSLVSFFEHFTYLVNEGDSVEQFFRLPYDNGLTIVGKFDRITKDGVVIDWKSGAQAPTDISGDIQFILYEYAYTKLYGEKPKKMLYVSLPTRKIVTYEPNPALIKEFFEVTMPFVADGLEFNMKKNLFVRTGLFGYKICDNCSFIDVCYKEIGI